MRKDTVQEAGRPRVAGVTGSRESCAPAWGPGALPPSVWAPGTRLGRLCHQPSPPSLDAIAVFRYDAGQIAAPRESIR